ncbi:UvrD-helicase domain-containing protein [Pseudomonas aeruginosa]|uniref:UvrD-helicase domain-containing protein n=1 Tax=Pseudomonas aeruginosa TaxID=287 RepID=UPI00053DDB83|nr:UvrD-helicase domain-containing protein [Pseudomonas aeruginosa]MCO2436387.1 DNA helicase UvrD [Pseudomonas aeruginosa]MCO3310790.1 DNA helicase UvrD [Pseudomonas aeruginosa]NPW58147.1 UvrD-helicase domain-containing protein [Pseudomonas aeruginosa]RQJ19587.1 DNA helicase UvrD [Pseudomonas aeruginosa]HBO2318251.1 UvrD-helicase domain-containing protein [Pseudomonas aeruginosa]
MPPEYDLFAYARGSITAPAGCGKTQIIADTLTMHRGPKPVLVLTHTNAGVTALRLRMKRGNVPASAYRIATLDGFAMRLVAMFPMRSGLAPEVLQLRNPATDYVAIRQAAFRLVTSGDLHDSLAATYAFLIVDEYQDCNLVQHAFVTGLSAVLRTCVLGDPMQAIFGFRGNALVDWNGHVLQQFPQIGELNRPWRWINAGTEGFGQWLLVCRRTLQAGGNIDLQQIPPQVTWIQLQAATATQQRLNAAMTRAPTPTGQVLVIGDSRNYRGRHQMASQTPGASTVEPVDLRDLTDFGAAFDLQAEMALTLLVNFAASVMTQVGTSTLLPRLDALRRRTARTPPSIAEGALMAFAAEPSYPRAATALRTLADQQGARVYRPDVFHCCLRALQMAGSGTCSFAEATARERERNRHDSRPLARRAIGSTLLLKGQEAEVAVIPNPESMDAKHLYVAMTRGSVRLVICSETPHLVPQAQQR